MCLQPTDSCINAKQFIILYIGYKLYTDAQCPNDAVGFKYMNVLFLQLFFVH